MIRTAQIPINQKDGLSWWIIHVDSTEDLLGSKIKWATPSIHEKVMENFTEKKLSHLEDYISQSLRIPSHEAPAPTKEYEIWVNNKIAEGMNLKLYKFSSDGKSTQVLEDLVLLKSELVRGNFYTFNIADLKFRYGGKLLTSTHPKAVLCDGAIIINEKLILIQHTISGKHSLNEKGLKDYAEDAKKNGLNELLLIYFVPQLSNFRILPKTDWDQAQAIIQEQSKSNMKIKVRVAELSPKESHLQTIRS
jgi:hypothetical protein